MEELDLDKEGFLKLAGQSRTAVEEEVLDPLTTPDSVNNSWEVDLIPGRGLVCELEQAEVDKNKLPEYYKQDAVSILNRVLGVKTGGDILMVKGQRNRIFKDKESGKITLRQESRDAVFLIRRGEFDPAYVSIPGTIVVDYIFTKKGFELKRVYFSNKVLHDFFDKPPHNPTLEQVDYIEQSAAKIESHTKKPIRLKLNSKQFTDSTSVIKDKNIPAVLTSITQADENSDDLKAHLASDFIKIDEKITAEEQSTLSKYYRKNMTALVSEVVAKKSNGSLMLTPEGINCFMSKDESGQIRLTIIMINPNFTSTEKPNFTVNIPGRITTDYIFNKDEGFELKEIIFSNGALQRAVMNPPKNPDEKKLKFFAALAKKQQGEQHEKRTEQLMAKEQAATPVTKTGKEFLAIAKTDSTHPLPEILADIKKAHPGSTQLTKDEKRIITIDANVTAAEKAQMEEYFTQPMLYILRSTFPHIQLNATDNTCEVHILKVNGQLTLRTSFTNPEFIVAPGGDADPFRTNIPGKMSVEYTFTEPKPEPKIESTFGQWKQKLRAKVETTPGFELKQVEFSNGILFLLATNPPKESHYLTKAYFESLVKLAGPLLPSPVKPTESKASTSETRVSENNSSPTFRSGNHK